jgi:hypothetical protein
MFTRTTWPPWPSWPLPPSVQAFSVHFRQRQPLEQATFGAFEWCLLLDPGCESWTSWTLIFIFITFVLFVLSQIRTKCCNMHWTYLQVRKKRQSQRFFGWFPQSLPYLTIIHHLTNGDVGRVTTRCRLPIILIWYTLGDESDEWAKNLITCLV